MISGLNNYSLFYRHQYPYKDDLYSLVNQPNTKKDAKYADNVIELTTEMGTVDYLNNDKHRFYKPTTYNQQQDILSLQKEYSLFDNPGLLPYSYDENKKELNMDPAIPPTGRYYDTYI